MFTQTFTLALLASASMVDARVPRHLGLHRRQNDDATSTTLAADAVQSGSFTDGSVNGDSAAGQAKSLTSQNNFINNCAGKTLTNGLQVQEGSCNGITMGDIPAKANMVSAVITFPTTGGDNVEADTSFDIEVQINNLVAGSFTNAASTYYTAPQALQGGKIIGHTHVTVQDLGNSLNPKQALDATQFAFFKGINDAGNGQGLLKATVTGGLPAGNYRVCTMTAASNHQPVLMPVAQRGTPDDCTKFVVGAAAGGNGGNGAAAGNGANGGNGAAAGNGANGGNGAATGNGANGGNGAAAGNGANGGNGAAAGNGANGGNGAAAGNGANGGNGATAGNGANGGNGAAAGNGANGGNGAAAGNGANGGNGAAAGNGANGGNGATRGNGTTTGGNGSVASSAAGGASASATQATNGNGNGDGTAASSAVESAATSAAAGDESAASSTSSEASAATSAAANGGKGGKGGKGRKGGKGASATKAANGGNAAASSAAAASATQAEAGDSAATSSAATASATEAATGSANTGGAVGGVAAPAVDDSGDAARPFSVNGNTFVNKAAAVQRSCDIQFNACADAFNNNKQAGVTMEACSAQQTTCNAQ